MALPRPLTRARALRFRGETDRVGLIGSPSRRISARSLVRIRLRSKTPRRPRCREAAWKSRRSVAAPGGGGRTLRASVRASRSRAVGNERDRGASVEDSAASTASSTFQRSPAVSASASDSTGSVASVLVELQELDSLGSRSRCTLLEPGDDRAGQQSLERGSRSPASSRSPPTSRIRGGELRRNPGSLRGAEPGEPVLEPRPCERLGALSAHASKAADSGRWRGKANASPKRSSNASRDRLSPSTPQQRFTFTPDPHWQGSLRPTFSGEARYLGPDARGEAGPPR